MACVYFNVKGKVQGVWFRQSTKHTAESLSITGWVRNKTDGSVELIACGEDEALAALEEWLYQGPPAANVESVSFEKRPLLSFENFQIR